MALISFASYTENIHGLIIANRIQLTAGCRRPAAAEKRLLHTKIGGNLIKEEWKGGARAFRRRRALSERGKFDQHVAWCLLLSATESPAARPTTRDASQPRRGPHRRAGRKWNASSSERVHRKWQRDEQNVATGAHTKRRVAADDTNADARRANAFITREKTQHACHTAHGDDDVI